MDNDNRRTDEHGWIRPGDMVGYEVSLWEKLYGSSFLQYGVHYEAAVKTGNHISVARMEKFAHAAAIARLRGGQV